MRWTVHGERTIYESDWIRLVLTDVEIPDGERFEHHVVRMPQQAAGAVVFDSERGLLLIWRHRFVTDTWGWEIPAGRIDDGETPIEAAARETLEETGWRPGVLAPLVRYQPHNGLSDLCSTSSLPTARRTSASPPTPARPNASSGSPSIGYVGSRAPKRSSTGSP